jgi:hypothetical protein
MRRHVFVTAIASLTTLSAGAVHAGDFAERLLSPNQIMANGSIPGDVGLYEKEFACTQTRR